MQRDSLAWGLRRRPTSSFLPFSPVFQSCRLPSQLCTMATPQDSFRSRRRRRVAGNHTATVASLPSLDPHLPTRSLSEMSAAEFRLLGRAHAADAQSNDDTTEDRRWFRYASRSVRELIEQMTSGVTCVLEERTNPRWPIRTTSRFIESLMYGLPTPHLLLWHCSASQIDVVDGTQRCLAIRDFMERGFALSGCYDRELNGVDESGVPEALRVAYVRVLQEATRRVARRNHTVGENLLATYLPRPTARSNAGLIMPLTVAAATNSSTALYLPVGADQVVRYGPHYTCGGSAMRGPEVRFGSTADWPQP